MGLLDRLQHAWNAFIGQENAFKKKDQYIDRGYGQTYRPDRMRYSKGNERSIVTSVYTRIAIDCASVDIKHVKLDEENRYVDDINSSLNECLTVRANKDQAARAFMQDVFMSLFDEGTIAIVPIDTSRDPEQGSYDIESLRTAKIVNWFPDYVTVNVYNDRTGLRQDIDFKKEDIAIIENPYYATMNEKNSVAQRLIRKLNLLDAIDEQSGAGKLDLIIQLPYTIKTETRRAQAEKRRKDIEGQLAGSKYGIAYTDGTEKITQLNRSVENNLLKQIEYLTSMLYSQLGIDETILNGTASETTMLNYMNRTVEPVVGAVVEEEHSKFLTKTARTQKQAIMYFNDPFKLIPLSSISDIADKFVRNEILSPNEIRGVVGFKPAKDPKADELRNPNINAGAGQKFATTDGKEITENPPKEETNQNG